MKKEYYIMNKQLNQMNSVELKAILFDLGELIGAKQNDYNQVRALLTKVIEKEKAVRIQEAEIKDIGNDSN